MLREWKRASLPRLVHEMEWEIEIRRDNKWEDKAVVISLSIKYEKNN